MKKGIQKIFHKKFSYIGETALLLAFFTLLSQFLGIFRDRFLAGRIGTGVSLDIYYSAFRIPDIIFVVGASLVSVSMLMPFFKEHLQREKKDAQKFIDSVFTVFVFFILGLNLFTFFLIPYIVPFLFPGFTPSAMQEVILLSRVMLLSPLLLGISNIFSTVVQSHQKFVVYALAPVFYNVGIIVGILFFYPYWGTIGLALGVVLGALLHLLIQFTVVRAEHFTPHFTLRGIHWEEIRKLVGHSVPRTITLSITKILFLILVAVASTFAVGSISIFQLSFNLQAVPLALIGVAYSVAAFPVLVSYYQDKKYDEFLSNVFIPIRQIVFWSLPVIALFIVLRAHIVRIILGTGNFNWEDTRLTAASLAILVFVVLAQGINLLFIRAYYAAGKTWKPFFIQLSSLVGTLISLKLFLWIFQHHEIIRNSFESLLRIQGIAGTEITMLSLSYVIGMYLALILFWFFFQHDFHIRPEQMRAFAVKRSFWESFLASVVLFFSTYFFLHITAPFFQQERTFGLLFHAFISVIPAILLWMLTLAVLQNREIRSLKKILLRVYKKLRGTRAKDKLVGDLGLPS